MQLIDHTPYLSENGEVSLGNQILAALKYGAAWYPEIKAQQIVIDILNRNLAKGYTLLRNIELPGSQATIPLILVGPAGVTVIAVTGLKGTYQAKGDNWEVIEGGKSRSIQPNLMLLTSKMALAVQHYFKKRGLDVAEVDGVLICAAAGLQVESSRPLVRVVMRDAIEHFVVSINHAGSILTAGMTQTIVRGLVNPRSITPPTPAIAGLAPKPVDDSAPIPALNDLLPWSGDNLEFQFEEDPTRDLDKPFSNVPEPVEGSSLLQSMRSSDTRPFYFDKKQWILLIAFGVVEIAILLIFFWLVFSNS
jgi:hypothetical protein